VALAADAEFPPAISLARVKGARTIGFFRESGENDIFFNGVRQGTLNGAADNKMEVILDVTVPFTSALTEESINNMKQIITILKEYKPDFVVGAVLEDGCHSFIKAMQAMNYTPSAVLLSECLSNVMGYKEVVGDAGRYVTGSTLWDHRLTGRIFNEDGSSLLHYFPAAVCQHIDVLYLIQKY